MDLLCQIFSFTFISQNSNKQIYPNINLIVLSMKSIIED